MFTIQHITVVVNYGTDEVMLHTDLPEGVWSWKDTGAVMQTSVAHGQGETWARKHFPDTKIEVVKLKSDFQ